MIHKGKIFAPILKIEVLKIGNVILVKQDYQMGILKVSVTEIQNINLVSVNEKILALLLGDNKRFSYTISCAKLFSMHISSIRFSYGELYNISIRSNCNSSSLALIRLI